MAARLHQPLQRALVRASQGWKLDDGIEGVSLDYQSARWERPRRIVGIRQHLKRRPDAKGKTLSLFAEDPTQAQVRYAALMTDVDLPALEVWRLYRGRAGCENRIKVLK